MGHTAGMHTESREAAIAYGKQMPASRVIINSPTTHGAIGFSTDLAPSMTLGCGSWGGNVTSDNVSPIHLMDIKRVAFETKAVSVQNPKSKVQSPIVADLGLRNADSEITEIKSQAENRRTVKREEIAVLVDKFLRNKISETPDEIQSPNSRAQTQIEAPNNQTTASNGEVKTIIHQVADVETAGSNGAKLKAVDFVSEDDVKKAVEMDEKIYISPKTIITPSARDLGEEKEIFVKA